MRAPSIFLLLIGLCSSCGLIPIPMDYRDEPDVLPPLTQEGAGTMGCLVNGEVLIGKESWDLDGPAVTCTLYPDNNILIALDDEVESQSFKIEFYPVGMGEDSLPDVPVRYHVFEEPYLNLDRLWLVIKNPTEETRIVAETENNWVEFTRYEPYRGGIMSGTFSFDMIGKYGYEGDTLRIREGRFDIKLRDYTQDID